VKRFKNLGIIVALTSATTIFNLKMIEAKAASDVSIGYSAHVQNIGDKQRVYDGQLMGTEGKSFRLEGINIALINPISGMSIKYRVHIQNIGWTNWLSSNQYAGTKDKSLRIEAIEIKLEGAPSNYHVEYQAHVQDIGWQSWVKDGQTAGTTGQSKRVEALRVKIVNYNEVNTSSLGVKYQSEIQNIGLQDRMSNGEITGTIGEGLRLEKINVSLENAPSGANITYRTHIEGRGWLGWVSSGTTTGAIGNDKRIESIEIKANGLPNGYHIEYRAHVQDIGWQNWVKDGQTAGTTGQSKRIEALKIRIVKDEAPNNGDTNISYIYTNYNVSLNDMVNIQLSKEPSLQMVNSNNQWEWRYAKITSDKQGYYYYPSANVTNFVEDNNVYNIIKDQLILNLDSSLSRNTDTYKYQFLKLSYVDGTTAQQLNSLFRPDGVLSGKGQVFIDAAKQYNVNPIYLASHAILETGNGTSPLAKGIDVNGAKVYNLFGIGAIDGNPDGAGSQYAYSKGWTSIDLAIYGGAEFTSSSYINSSYKQDTIYKMRWNPGIPGVHQYATDVKWATNQVANIKKMFDQIPDAKLVFDIPVYK
jgi:beta-N-acetylglucosaminidase